MIVRLLGPVEVTGPHGRAVLSGRQRALVGVLALGGGSVLVPARVAEALWGDDPPRTAVKSLQSHVARIRQALRGCGLPDVVLTKGAGYALALAREDIDACRFEDQVRAARAELARGRWADAADQLRAGLALWAGDPVQDGSLAGWGRSEVARLEEVRLTALEDLFDAEVRLGRHTEAIAELERLLVRHPLRERLVELLMLALYRAGRQLDALEVYQRVRTRLAAELGVDPAAGLRRLHTAILRQDPVLAPQPEPPQPQPPTQPQAQRAGAVQHRPPAQLPPRAGHFTGRTGELKVLDRLLDVDDDARVAVIYGPGGVGKTSLAVQWAHGVRDRFPDGQIFSDLRGHDGDTATAPVEALQHVLRGLGVPGDQLGGDLAELTCLFRSVLDGRRVLIVLDNAATVDQVRPLVPATPASALVVTGRRPMTSLATYHAVHALRLDVHGDEDAVALLRSVVGAGRVDREPDEAARIAASCGRLPLALRIAAAKLLGQPGRTLHALAEELTGADRLDALSVEGDRSVRTVFASAYSTLSAPAATVFRRVGVHPGATFGRHLVVAVADLSPVEAQRALAELTGAYLVAEDDRGRFRLHDLIQVYANECGRRDDTPGTRAETGERLVDWYIGVAAVASGVLDRGRDEVTPRLRYPLPEVPFPTDHQGALDFLDGERDNLLPVVRFAAEQGRYEAAWQLTYLLTGFFSSRGRWADRVEICRLGLAAAQRLDDPAAEVLMRSGLGVALIVTRRFDEALDCLYPALELARTSGDRRREGHVWNNIATAYARLRRFDEALEAYLRALDVQEAGGDRLGTALACNNIATAYVRLGRPERSHGYLDRALALAREIDNPRIEAEIRYSSGEAHLRQGRGVDALAAFSRSLDIRRAIGDQRREVDTLLQLGLANLALGDGGERTRRAEAHYLDALRLSRDLGDQHLVSVSRTHLAGAYLRAGNLTGAAEQLDLALALRSTVPDAYEEATINRAMAEVAERAGRTAAATGYRERAVALFHKANATAEAAALAAG